MRRVPSLSVSLSLSVSNSFPPFGVHTSVCSTVFAFLSRVKGAMDTLKRALPTVAAASSRYRSRYRYRVEYGVLLPALVACLLAGLPTFAADDEENLGAGGEVHLVDKDNPLPANLAKTLANYYCVGRLKTMVAELPAGHQVKVYAGIAINLGNRTAHTAITRMQVVDAKGVPDGVEYYGDDPAPSRIVRWRAGAKDGLEEIRGAGVIREVMWKAGQMDGPNRTYIVVPNPDPAVKEPLRVLQSEALYVAGAPEGETRVWDRQGRLAQVVPYRQGKRHGLMVDYWPATGKPKREAPYAAGELEGVVKEYFESGVLKSERPFKAGKREGTERQYAGDGKLASEVKWANDREAAP